jgi:hypothetical protein
MGVARWLPPSLALAGLLGLAGGHGTAPADAQVVAPGTNRTTTPAPVHGTPKGWRFTWPPGNPAKGREVFQKLQCYSCHEVRGERFPGPTDTGRLGPELSTMGPMHPPEFFAESIINPSAVVERSTGTLRPTGPRRCHRTMTRSRSRRRSTSSRT